MNAGPVPLIEAVGLQKHYPLGDGSVPVLHGIDLRISAGEFVAVMGPSGSGKSTLLQLLGCLQKPTAGSYRLDGADVTAMDAKAQARVRNSTMGFVFQTYNLLPRTSALANVELPLFYRAVTGRERRRRAMAALERVGMAGFAAYTPNRLSGGQQQRVAIARALVSEPRLILADEPTGALETRSTVEVLGLFQALNRSGITVVLITHEPYVAEFAGRVLRIREGRIVADDAVARPRRAEDELAALGDAEAVPA